MCFCGVWLNAPVNLEKVFSEEAVSRSDKKKNVCEIKELFLWCYDSVAAYLCVCVHACSKISGVFKFMTEFLSLILQEWTKYNLPACNQVRISLTS